MEIRFISSLTADDEERLAHALLQVVCWLLDRLPISYTLRFETTGGTAVQRIREATASDHK